MPRVESTAIVRIEWADEVLSVWFTSDPSRRYMYFGVPRLVYDAFLTASSKGTFFANLIRDRYDFR